MCGAVETIDHIFFACPLGSFVWCCIRDTFGWESFPTSTTDFMESWLPDKLGVHKHLAMFIFAGLMWAIWRKRNKMAIEKIFPKTPSEALLYGLSFMQKWELLLKEDDRRKLSEVRRQVLMMLHNLPPARVPMTDIGEI